MSEIFVAGFVIQISELNSYSVPHLCYTICRENSKNIFFNEAFVLPEGQDFKDSICVQQES